MKYMLMMHAPRAGWEKAGIATWPMDDIKAHIGFMMQFGKELKEAGFEAQCLAPVPGERVRAPWLRRLGNAVRQIYVAIRLTR